MPKQSVVPVRASPRGRLYALIQQGHAPARTVRRAPTRRLAEEQQPTPSMAAM